MAGIARLGAVGLLAGACLLLTACAGVPAGSERVLSFHSDITVQPDATLSVRETIKVSSSGIVLRHGIVRDFLDEAGDRSFRLTDVLRDGEPAAHSTRDVAGGLRLYVGLQDELLPPGEHTYTIAFRTSRGLSTEGGRRVLGWNVTGYQWPIPIDAVSAALELPAPAPRDTVRIQAFSGSLKASREDVAFWVDDQGRVQFESHRALGIGEGLRVLVSWPLATAMARGNGKATADGSP